jgi:hypothetical protein
MHVGIIAMLPRDHDSKTLIGLAMDDGTERTCFAHQIEPIVSDRIETTKPTLVTWLKAIAKAFSTMVSR